LDVFAAVLPDADEAVIVADSHERVQRLHLATLGHL
jgi:hypothetical protein